MSQFERLVAGLLFVLTLSVFGRSEAVDLTCSSSSTLEALASCVRMQMPQSGSNGFVAPSAAEQGDWRAAVNQMLQGSCSFSLPANLLGIAQLREFTDAGNGRRYCLLMEVRDADGDGFVDRGWGTFVVYGAARRELSHQAPHPISDSTTELQAISIFKQTDSRSYLMAGSHRNANGAASQCQSSYKEADAAHNTENMFHAANLELMAFYGTAEWNAIQWHGMAADTCPNTHVYLSHGVNVLPATVGEKKITLSWKPSAGATAYNVKRRTGSAARYMTIATGVAGTSYINTGLTSGVTYYYVVSATNAGGESANSNQASAKAK